MSAVRLLSSLLHKMDGLLSPGSMPLAGLLNGLVNLAMIIVDLICNKDIYISALVPCMQYAELLAEVFEPIVHSICSVI